MTGNGLNPNPPRKSVARAALLLTLATAALVAFILGLGDFRRQRNALAQMHWHASIYERRIGVGGVMPLNFEPDTAAGAERRMIPLQFLDHASAVRLRSSDKPVMVAQTIPITQVFGKDGRAVMTFKGGKFAVEWMTLAQFDALWAAQQGVVSRLEAEKAGEAPRVP